MREFGELVSSANASTVLDMSIHLFENKNKLEASQIGAYRYLKVCVFIIFVVFTTNLIIFYAFFFFLRFLSVLLILRALQRQ